MGVVFMIMIDRVYAPSKRQYDGSWAIVRSASKLPDGFDVCNILSPGGELWRSYCGVRDRYEQDKAFAHDYWDKVYLPEFLSQMRYDQRAANVLNGLVELDKAGANIRMCCFCKDESLCHRSIIAGVLQGAGADVRLPSGADYSRYFKMYQEAPLTRWSDIYQKGVAQAAQQRSASVRTLGSEFNIPGGFDGGSGMNYG